MIFSAQLGAPASAAEWLRVVGRHAAWLGMQVYDEARPLADGRTFSFGWIHPRGWLPDGLACDARGRLLLTTARGLAADDAPARQQSMWDVHDAPSDTAVIGVGLALDSGELRARVPPACAASLFVVNDRRGTLLGTDLRLMLRWVPLEIDEAAVYAFLRYGTTPPPRTVSRGVRRVPGGHLLVLRAPDQEPTTRPYFRLAPATAPELADVEARLLATLDDVLAALPTSSMMFFSGGVDSALLAARLRGLGRADTRLLNLAFAADDPEARQAADVAAALGMPLEQTAVDASRWADRIDRLGTDFSVPFGDIGMFTREQLVGSFASGLSSDQVIVGGEGGDQLFLFPAVYGQRWNRVYALPRWYRQLGAAAYRAGRMWARGERMERVNAAARAGIDITGRLGLLKPGMLRRSVMMPPPAAATSLHALDGIMYRVPGRLRDEVAALAESPADGVADALSWLDRGAWSVLASQADAHQPKSYDPLLAAGARFTAPFLHPSLLRACASIPWERKIDGADTRALQRRLLVRSLPPAMSYTVLGGGPRPSPETLFAGVLAGARMQAFYHDVVLAPGSPIAPLVRPNAIRRMVEGARRRPLTAGTNAFVWTVGFLSAWLQQIESR